MVPHSFTHKLPTMKRAIGPAGSDPSAFNAALFTIMGQIATVVEDFRVEIVNMLLCLVDEGSETTLFALDERAAALTPLPPSSPFLLACSTLPVLDSTVLLIDACKAIATCNLLKGSEE